MFLNPSSMVKAIEMYAEITDQKIPHTIGELARCIYDNLALSYNKVLGELEAITNSTYSNLNIVGGGSKNIFLNQLTANITKRNIIAGYTETSGQEMH